MPAHGRRDHRSQESTPTDAQRLLRQAMPGAELVLAEFSGSPTVPSFFLARRVDVEGGMEIN